MAWSAAGLHTVSDVGERLITHQAAILEDDLKEALSFLLRGLAIEQHIVAVDLLDAEHAYGRLLDAVVGLRVLGQLTRLAVDDAGGCLHGHAEGVAREVLVAVTADAQNHIGLSKTLELQALKDLVGALERDGVTVDQADTLMEDLEALRGFGTAEDVPKALDCTAAFFV